MFFKKTKKISLHLRKIMNFEETTAILLMARAISQNLPPNKTDINFLYI
jgi:hypothetical protein